MAREQWGVRLADVRVPTYWWVSIGVALIITRFLDRRDSRELARIGSELGTYYGNRDAESGEREAQLVKLTRTLLWLTVAAVMAAVVSIVVAVFR